MSVSCQDKMLQGVVLVLIILRRTRPLFILNMALFCAISDVNIPLPLLLEALKRLKIDFPNTTICFLW